MWKYLFPMLCVGKQDVVSGERANRESPSRACRHAYAERLRVHRL